MSRAHIDSSGSHYLLNSCIFMLFLLWYIRVYPNSNSKPRDVATCYLSGQSQDEVLKYTILWVQGLKVEALYTSILHYIILHMRKYKWSSSKNFKILEQFPGRLVRNQNPGTFRRNSAHALRICSKSLLPTLLQPPLLRWNVLKWRVRNVLEEITAVRTQRSGPTARGLHAQCA